MFKDTHIIIERDHGQVCIRWNHGRLRFEPREARRVAADLDRMATEIGKEILNEH